MVEDQHDADGGIPEAQAVQEALAGVASGAASPADAREAFEAALRRADKLRKRSAWATSDALSPSEALAVGVREARGRRDWHQDELARRMSDLGFKWSKATVSRIEGYGPASETAQQRPATLDEAFALCVVTGESLHDLLTTAGVPVHIRGPGHDPRSLARLLLSEPDTDPED